MFLWIFLCCLKKWGILLLNNNQKIMQSTKKKSVLYTFFIFYVFLNSIVSNQDKVLILRMLFFAHLMVVVVVIVIVGRIDNNRKVFLYSAVMTHFFLFPYLGSYCVRCIMMIMVIVWLFLRMCKDFDSKEELPYWKWPQFGE